MLCMDAVNAVVWHPWVSNSLETDRLQLCKLKLIIVYCIHWLVDMYHMLTIMGSDLLLHVVARLYPI